MTEREKKAEDRRRVEIAMMRHLIERYPQQAYATLRNLSKGARTVRTDATHIVVQSA